MPVARALALLLTAMLTVMVLAAVPSAASARAATGPCTVTWSVPGGQVPVKKTGTTPPEPFGLAWFDLQVPDGRIVADLDYSVDLASPAPGQLGVQVFGPQSVNQQPLSWAWGVASGVSGSLDGSYTFDDEAGTVMGGASPPPGRYRPAVEPAANLEGKPAAGQWRLAIANGSTTQVATVRSFAVTLTFATCDTDGDGADDRSDNCEGLANDQSQHRRRQPRGRLRPRHRRRRPRQRGRRLPPRGRGHHDRVPVGVPVRHARPPGQEEAAGGQGDVTGGGLPRG